MMRRGLRLDAVEERSLVQRLRRSRRLRGEPYLSIPDHREYSASAATLLPLRRLAILPSRRRALQRSPPRAALLPAPDRPVDRLARLLTLLIGLFDS
jgi:hypothetical protein